MSYWIITGGYGLLGSHLVQEGKKQNIYLLPLDKKHCNILWSEPPEYEIGDVDLKGIIHCAAYTNVPGAETPEGKKQAIELNVFGTKNVKDWTEKYNLSLIYISTDYVYAGTIGNYKETDMPQPINHYACTKLMGEAYLDLNKDLIIRTSFKPNVKWAYPKAFDDLYSSTDYVDVIANKILFLIDNFDKVSKGIINVGTERKSIFDLAKRRNTFVEPMSKKDIMNVRLPEDISLDTTKYDKLYNLIIGEKNAR